MSFRTLNGRLKFYYHCLLMLNTTKVTGSVGQSLASFSGSIAVKPSSRIDQFSKKLNQFYTIKFD